MATPFSASSFSYSVASSGGKSTQSIPSTPASVASWASFSMPYECIGLKYEKSTMGIWVTFRSSPTFAIISLSDTLFISAR